MHRINQRKMILWDKFQSNRPFLLRCLLYTFIWGLAAHGTMYLHNSISHDSLNEFVSDMRVLSWKISLGRVLYPVYQALTRGFITLPWLVGLLTLLYTGMAVFLVMKLFDVKSRKIAFLAAGIFTANITVIAVTATYINDLDADLFAMLLAVGAAYLWRRGRRGLLPGAFLLAFSLGLYQSYLAMTITLILMASILDLLDGRAWKGVFRRGWEGIGMLIGGGVLYIIELKIGCLISGVSLQSGSYNSLDRMLSMSPAAWGESLLGAYASTLSNLIQTKSILPETLTLFLHVGILAVILFVLLRELLFGPMSLGAKLLTIVLTALLPLGMNVAHVLSNNTSHDLMHYAFWMAYLFALLLAERAGERWKSREFEQEPGENKKELRKYEQDSVPYEQDSRGNGQRFRNDGRGPWNDGRWGSKGRSLRTAAALLVLVILWGNVRFANTAYAEKYREQEANLSLFTRIVLRMEEMDGYVTGETPVVFAGKPNSVLQRSSEFSALSQLTGLRSAYVPGQASRNYYQAYFEYVLLNPAVMAEASVWTELRGSEEVAAMPCYPEEGSFAIIDGVLVVKLGD
ncbi:MAG: glucosyltransferase domain-containing protein [Lachnospiraceae bacterium]|nr:glucosyltransferase domain-containing protein [Lachnospiraceae bacterium]